MSDLDDLLNAATANDVAVKAPRPDKPPRTRSPDDARRLHSMEGRLNKAEAKNKEYRRTLKQMQTALCQLHVRAKYVPIVDDKLVEEVDKLMFCDVA